MTTKLLDTLRQIITDRYTTILAAVVLVLMVLFCSYVGLRIHSSEIQVLTHYTAYGVTNFYLDRWYYLLSFIGFGFVVGVSHVFLIGKLYEQKGRTFALAFGWFTVAFILITWVLVASILRVAFHS